MEQAVETGLVHIDQPDINEAWEMVSGQLRMEMNRADYESWVHSLRPLGYKEGVYRLGTMNHYARNWVESRLSKKIEGLLEMIYQKPLSVRFCLINGVPPAGEASSGRKQNTGMVSSAAERDEKPGAAAQTLDQEPVVEEPAPQAESTARTPSRKRKSPAKSAPDELEEGGSPRKIQLQRAYGTARARVIQPERGMFMTNYFFTNWLPLLGHSAMTTVLAARSLCYWNPMTGELRNVIETEMAELARRASVSVRTVKDVLNNELVKRYFLRYKVRRVMTPNGVRTAGIILQVRMDDPLTPEDQAEHNLPEDEHWYAVDFEDEAD